MSMRNQLSKQCKTPRRVIPARKCVFFVDAPLRTSSGAAHRAREHGSPIGLPSGPTSQLGVGKPVLMPSHIAVIGATSQGKTAAFEALPTLRKTSTEVYGQTRCGMGASVVYDAGYDALRLTDAQCAAILRNATIRLSLMKRKP